MTKFLNDYVPALKYGAKILSSEVSGMIGLPYVGDVFYVDPSGGSDSASGLSQTDAKKTIASAQALLADSHQDVVLVVPSGGTGRTTETTAIDWDKRFSHLVGNAGIITQDTRAGISFGTGGSLTVSENGCIIKGLTLNGSADINVPVTVTGSYNQIAGVDFKGSLNSTTGDHTAARALYINGGQENTFYGCTFGADTIMRSAANATLEFASAASRNVFEECRFIMAVDNAGPVHVLFTGTSAIDRWIEFKNSTFYSFSANDGTAATACMNLSAQSATGHVLLTGATSLMGGITDWEATASGNIYMQSATATANIIGLPVNPTVS